MRTCGHEGLPSRDCICTHLREAHCRVNGAISYDGVKHCLLAALDGRPPRLDLADYPRLPLPELAIIDPMAYNELLLAAVETP